MVDDVTGDRCSYSEAVNMTGFTASLLHFLQGLQNPPCIKGSVQWWATVLFYTTFQESEYPPSLKIRECPLSGFYPFKRPALYLTSVDISSSARCFLIQLELWSVTLVDHHFLETECTDEVSSTFCRAFEFL